MFIEEKIDILTKQFSAKDLVIRYTAYKSVMTKIEHKFLRKINSNLKYCEWLEKFKDYNAYDYQEDTFSFLAQKLLPNEKYWWIFVDSPGYSTSRHRLFDATLIVGESLSYIFHDSPIYIVHKKYEFMLLIDRKIKNVKEKVV